MRVLITGDREWDDEGTMYEGFDHINDYLSFDLDIDPFVEPPIIVEGCARGADQMAERLAQMIYHWPVEHHQANWGKHGNAAGIIRNQEMLDAPGGIDLCLAFHPNLKRSKGTLDMIERCLRAGIEVRLYPRS
jgi:hypothetical protein